MESQAIIAALRRSREYTKKDHYNWVDQHHFGVSHVGIPPQTWLILSLTFETCHDCVNYLKLQVDYICKMFEVDFEALDKFSRFLLSSMKTWKSFQVTPWLKNDKYSRQKDENTKELELFSSALLGVWGWETVRNTNLIPF